MSLSREQILAKRDDIPTKVVDVPQWNDKVRVRCLSLADRLEWGLAQQKAEASEPGPNPGALLLALGIVDDDGNRMFSAQDSDALAVLRGDVADNIGGEILELSGMTAKAVEDAEGNSETPSGDSPSSSPSDSGEPSPN